MCSTCEATNTQFPLMLSAKSFDLPHCFPCILCLALCMFHVLPHYLHSSFSLSTAAIPSHVKTCHTPDTTAAVTATFECPAHFRCSTEGKSRCHGSNATTSSLAGSPTPISLRPPTAANSAHPTVCWADSTHSELSASHAPSAPPSAVECRSTASAWLPPFSPL